MYSLYSYTGSKILILKNELSHNRKETVLKRISVVVVRI